MNLLKSNARVTLVLGAFLSVFASNVIAQTPEARCEKLLPLKALTAAAGTGFTAHDAVERKPGELECSWLKRGSGSMQTLFVGHKSKSALADWGRNFTPAKSNNDWWEDAVKNTEDASKGRREIIPGVGKRAALVAMPGGGSQKSLKAFVQRDDDVFEIVSMNVNTADIGKIAKAVSTP
jgi:hypothetical protein